ncbi:MAG: DUF308 domain-containing protein [Solirubrobacterales bacterium]|nr:DUF308 domain-containing protein [Solirubrobacterales bacterium]MBV9366341.1 DUF308 domain-containing protein [Solirubrobacterales bacterium]MBV9684463.1 DUF308 domain-containing protein [Solirubrobacterales bacterium]MBV9805787.1 DUF308 domain-containing protein [Solirubrobacterales bacterium]
MPTPVAIKGEGEAEPRFAWWLFLLVGLLSVVAGGILVAKPSHSLATLAVVMGIFLLIDGIIELVLSLGRSEANRALAAIVGLLTIVVGILLIRHPTHAVNAIGLIIGIWLVAAGVMRLLRAGVTGGLLRAAIAVLEIVVGVVVVSDPHIGYATLAILVGIWLIVNGLAWIGLGFVVRTAR